VRLFLVRHAEAAPGTPDDLRALTPRGREQARALGTRLAADGLRPDVLVSSPLLRARETAEELGRALGVDPEADERLAPGATADDVLAAANGRGETVLVVGHEPDCGEIVAALTGGPPPAFAPAELAVVEVD
jgi:phosphohistidine phosphatase